MAGPETDGPSGGGEGLGCLLLIAGLAFSGLPHGDLPWSQTLLVLALFLLASGGSSGDPQDPNQGDP